MTTPTGDPWFQTLFADRIGGANYGKSHTIYKFEKIKRAKRAALAAHPERQLLDFGIGENDDMAAPPVSEARLHSFTPTSFTGCRAVTFRSQMRCSTDSSTSTPWRR